MSRETNNTTPTENWDRIPKKICSSFLLRGLHIDEIDGFVLQHLPVITHRSEISSDILVVQVHSSCIEPSVAVRRFLEKHNAQFMSLKRPLNTLVKEYKELDIDFGKIDPVVNSTFSRLEELDVRNNPLVKFLLNTVGLSSDFTGDKAKIVIMAELLRRAGFSSTNISKFMKKRDDDIAVDT